MTSARDPRALSLFTPARFTAVGRPRFGTARLSAVTYAAALALLGGCGDAPVGGACEGLLPGDLVISEVMANPSGADDGREWVEIVNTTSGPVDLTGVELVRSAEDGTGARAHVIAAADALAAGAYFVLGGVLEAARPTYVDYGFGADLGAFGNTAGRVVLRCGDRVLDEVVYLSTTDGASRAYDGALPPNATANDDTTRWCDSTTTFSTGDFGSPGVRNPSCGSATTGRCSDGGEERDAVPPTEGDLVITELHPNPSAVADGEGEWFEVLALADVDLNGLELGKEAGTVLETLSGADCLSVSAGTYVLFAANADALTNGGLTGVDYVADLALANTGGSLFVGYGGSVLDTFTYTSSADGASTQLDPRHLTFEENDDEALWCRSEAAYGDGDLGTPGDANMQCMFPIPDGMCDDAGTPRAIVSPTLGDVVITEVMPNPDATDDAVGEWFELYATAAVDLNGLQTGGTLGTPLFTLDQQVCVRVAAGSYVLFARNGDMGVNGGLDANAIAYGFNLTNTNGSLFIGVEDGLLDSVAWTASPTGASLQLEPSDFDHTTNDAFATVACDATAAYGAGDLGTPGTDNGDCLDAGECWDGAAARAIVTPAVGDLYINEVMANPATSEPTTEWFELVATADIDLNDVSVTNGTQSYAFASMDCLPVNTGELLVFARSTDPMMNGDVSGVDFVYASVTMTNTNSTLSITSSSATLDTVTWTSTSNGLALSLVPGLTDPHLANDTLTNWCDANAPYGDISNNNFGTPGDANTPSSCP